VRPTLADLELHRGRSASAHEDSRSAAAVFASVSDETGVPVGRSSVARFHRTLTGRRARTNRLPTLPKWGRAAKGLAAVTGRSPHTKGRAVRPRTPRVTACSPRAAGALGLSRSARAPHLFRRHHPPSLVISRNCLRISLTPPSPRFSATRSAPARLTRRDHKLLHWTGLPAARAPPATHFCAAFPRTISSRNARLGCFEPFSALAGVSPPPAPLPLLHSRPAGGPRCGSGSAARSLRSSWRRHGRPSYAVQ
jgi:hypothetical protein